MKPKLPKNIRIGGLDFKVVPIRGELNESRTTVGNYRPHAQVIGLHEGLTDQALGNTLIHEVLHALFSHQGLDESSIKECEEFTVNSFANGIAMIMRQNPKLMGQIQALIDGRPRKTSRAVTRTRSKPSKK